MKRKSSIESLSNHLPYWFYIDLLQNLQQIYKSLYSKQAWANSFLFQCTLCWKIAQQTNNVCGEITEMLFTPIYLFSKLYMIYSKKKTPVYLYPCRSIVKWERKDLIHLIRQQTEKAVVVTSKQSYLSRPNFPLSQKAH